MLGPTADYVKGDTAFTWSSFTWTVTRGCFSLAFLPSCGSALSNRRFARDHRLQSGLDNSSGALYPLRGIHPFFHVSTEGAPSPSAGRVSAAHTIVRAVCPGVTRFGTGRRRSQMVRTTKVWACASWSVRLLLPSVASAQQASASGIAGVVRDTSGAVLPGVTVEASSPALIEKTRSVVSDTEGRYNIIDLRPGTYLVTFSLSGFNMFRRDGIELTSGFTATVNADMQVGALTETITVTGESPLVDTRNARKQTGRHGRPAQRAPEQREEPEQPGGADAGIPRKRRIRRDRRVQRSDRRNVPRQRRHQRPVRRHGHPARLGQPGLQRQRRDRAGTGDVPRAASRPTATPTAPS